VTGFYARTSSQTDAFLRLGSGRFLTLAVPGAAMTQALGVNDSDEVVGVYTVGSGDGAQLHAFTWRPGPRLPHRGRPARHRRHRHQRRERRRRTGRVYTDAAGNTDGMIALPW
jgi:hypothetical protein